ncbi:MAG: helix-turn-helix domain-containing protein [Bryobacteraceae bacterium]
MTANPTNGWYARFLREVFLATAQMAPRHDRTSVRHSDAKIHRIRSGVSLELICERTKISRHFLEAIEERAYQRLPGGIFDISYIRQYAEQIGYSAESLLEDYRSRSGAKESSSNLHAVPARPKTWWKALL